MPGVSGFNEWADRQQPEITLEKYIRLPDATGIAIVLGQVVRDNLRLIAVDIDSVSPDILDLCPPSPSGKVGRRGETRYFLAGPWLTRKAVIMRPNKGDPETGKEKEGIEILCNGGYTVEAGSIHPDTGRPYVARGIPIVEFDLEDLPEFTQAEMKRIEDHIRATGGHEVGATDLAGVLHHPDGSRCPHGSHDRVKAMAAGFISAGKPIDEAVRELLRYDETHHKPIGYFSDKTRSDWRGDSFTTALSFYSSMMGSINRERVRNKLEPQIPKTVSSLLTIVNLDPSGKTEAEAWDCKEVSRSELYRRVDFDTSDKGKPFDNLSNMGKLLSRKPAFAAGIWYDEFHQKVFTTVFSNAGEEPKEWRREHTLALQKYAQSSVGFHRINKTTVEDAVYSYARSNIRNEVKEWLEALPAWDGVGRIGVFCSAYLGSEQNDYTQAVGENLFTSLVSRIMNPGKQADCMMILEGPQGARKSTALRSIVGTRWFGEATADIHTKDFMQSLGGKWLIEIPELDAMVRSEAETIKRVLSTQSDRLRLPYAPIVEEFPRRSIFAGTTNQTGYLKDSTGARRFWPVECGTINVERIVEDRLQLFAEALARFKSGGSWWNVPTEHAKREANERYEGDVWEDIVFNWIKNGRIAIGGVTEVSLTAANILMHSLGKRAGDLTKADMSRIKSIMLRGGYVQNKNVTPRAYKKRERL